MNEHPAISPAAHQYVHALLYQDSAKLFPDFPPSSPPAKYDEEFFARRVGGSSGSYAHDHVRENFRVLRQAATPEELNEKTQLLMAHENSAATRDWLRRLLSNPAASDDPALPLNAPDDATLDRAQASMRQAALIQAIALAEAAGLNPDTCLKDPCNEADYTTAQATYAALIVKDKPLPEAMKAFAQAAQEIQDCIQRGEWREIPLPADTMDYFKDIKIAADANTGYQRGRLIPLKDFSEDAKLKRARLAGYRMHLAKAKTLGELADMVRYGELDAQHAQTGHFSDTEATALHKAFDHLCTHRLGIAPVDLSGISEGEAKATFETILQPRIPKNELRGKLEIERHRTARAAWSVEDA